MKRPKVIDPKCLPANPFRPLGSAGLLYLLLDKLQAPGWACGVLWTVFLLAWIGLIAAFYAQKEVNIFDASERSPDER